MKRFLFFGILLISTILVAGWRWARVNTTNTPLLSSDDFHISYDDTLKKMILTADCRNSYTFDGKSWDILCEDNPEVCTGFSLYNSVYVSHLSTSMDFQIEGKQEYAIFGTYILNADGCWDFLQWGQHSLANGTFSVAYDVHRGLLIFMVQEAFSGYWYTYEYDGEAFYFYPAPDYLHFDYGFLVYYPGIDRTLFFGAIYGGPSFGVALWNGTAWEIIDSPLPPDPGYLFGPAEFFPELGGVVFLSTEHTLLYQDFQWSIIIPNQGLNGFGRLVYFPPEKAMYLFVSTRDNELRIYRLRNYHHDRPFERPQSENLHENQMFLIDHNRLLNKDLIN